MYRVEVLTRMRVLLVGFTYLKDLEDVENVVGMFFTLKYTVDFTVNINFSFLYTLMVCFRRTHVAFFGRRHDY